MTDVITLTFTVHQFLCKDGPAKSSYSDYVLYTTEPLLCIGHDGSTVSVKSRKFRLSKVDGKPVSSFLASDVQCGCTDFTQHRTMHNDIYLLLLVYYYITANTHINVTVDKITTSDIDNLTVWNTHAFQG